MAAIDDLKSWSRSQGAPATIGLLASFIVTALFFWFSQMRGADLLMVTPDSLVRPWSFFTYPWTANPLAGYGLLFFIFFLMWMFWVGTSLERQMGSKMYILLWFIIVLISGITMWLGALLLNINAGLGGPYLPVSALSVVWCARNQTAIIRLWGILPLSGKWLALLLAGMTFFSFGTGVPLYGAIALIPLALGWFYGLGKLPQLEARRGREKVRTTRGQVAYDDTYFTDVQRREKEREERERLRKLFEGSLSDDEGR
jgi:membrane associated rhomboid family serine protease